MIETIENELLKIDVSTSGAELQSVYHKEKKVEYLWQGSPEWWPRKAPVLFPIVGKLKDNAYRIGGKAFSLPQHGFARDKEFSVAEKKNNAIAFILHSNEEVQTIYPYPFRLTVSYWLQNSRLYCSYKVANTGEDDMYFSIGAHPGFNCPLRKKEKFSDYYIEFEKPETLDRHTIEDGLLNGKTERILTEQKILPLTEDLFINDAIVLESMQSTHLFLKSKVSDDALKFSYEGFPYFGIWTKPGAPFICLEPWCGIANSKGFSGELKDKEGIISLKGEEVFTRTFSIEI